MEFYFKKKEKENMHCLIVRGLTAFFKKVVSFGEYEIIHATPTDFTVKCQDQALDIYVYDQPYNYENVVQYTHRMVVEEAH